MPFASKIWPELTTILFISPIFIYITEILTFAYGAASQVSSE